MVTRAERSSTSVGRGNKVRRRIEERLDAALAQSFPASDPPPWTLGQPEWASAASAGHTDGPRAVHPTKNDLGEALRGSMIELLNARLADAVDLHTQCKQAHWNVRGPSFFSLHELFDHVAEDAQEYADALAERVAQLGGVASGTARCAARCSTLPEYPAGAAAGAEHITAMASALATFGRAVRAAIVVSANDGDADTADLFTEISRGVDQWLWMVEAHAHPSR